MNVYFQDFAIFACYLMKTKKGHVNGRLEREKKHHTE